MVPILTGVSSEADSKQGVIQKQCTWVVTAEAWKSPIPVFIDSAVAAVNVKIFQTTHPHKRETTVAGCSQMDLVRKSVEAGC